MFRSLQALSVRETFLREVATGPANILDLGTKLIPKLNETSCPRYMQSKDHPWNVPSNSLVITMGNNLWI